MSLLYKLSQCSSLCLEVASAKIHPYREREIFGEDVTFMCDSGSDNTRWFFYKEDSLPKNAVAAGTKKNFLTIERIKNSNIGRYCCYGLNKDTMKHFFDCAYLDLKGKLDLELRKIGMYSIS